MWTYSKKILEADKIYQYKIFEKETPLSFEKVIELWKTNTSFRQFYAKILTDSTFDALFWEHPPITKINLKKEYEFVLINSRALTSVKPESHVFKEHFNVSESVVSFSSLRGDALLTVPKPLTGNENYTHLVGFLRTAPQDQIDFFWEKVSTAFSSKIGFEKKWLNTAGQGVYWCHVRVDSRPKYYKFSDYRNQ